MTDTTKVPPGRLRFKLHSFGEMGHYAKHPTQWDQECKRNGADMAESPEDEAVRELAMRCVELKGRASHR